jgi:hypothetical protein
MLELMRQRPTDTQTVFPFARGLVDARTVKVVRGTSRWAGRTHHVVHLDSITGPRFEAFKRQHPEIVASRWVGALIEEAMLEHETKAKRARKAPTNPANPWEAAPFWAKDKGKR